jgi:hypothetical protein
MTTTTIITRSAQNVPLQYRRHGKTPGDVGLASPKRRANVVQTAQTLEISAGKVCSTTLWGNGRLHPPNLPQSHPSRPGRRLLSPPDPGQGDYSDGGDDVSRPGAFDEYKITVGSSLVLLFSSSSSYPLPRVFSSSIILSIEVLSPSFL